MFRKKLIDISSLICIFTLCFIMPCNAQEKERLIAERDAYTLVMCYYDDALDYAIANLKSEELDSRNFAMDIATRIINLRFKGDNPSKEILLYSLFQETDTTYHMKFESAVAQARLGSTEGLSILLKEFITRELPYDSRLHALQFLLDEGKARQFKVLFEQALSDDRKVAALGALGLYHIGDEKAKQWLLDQISLSAHNRPVREILEVIQEAKVTEAIPLLKPGLTYAGPNMTESEARARQFPVAVTLTVLGDEDGKKFLLDILSKPEERGSGVVGQAALCIAGLGDPALIPELRNALSVRIRLDKFEVIEALLMLNDSQVIPELLNEMEANDGWDKKAVQLAIKYKITQALPALQRHFDQKNQKEQIEFQLQEDKSTIAFYEQLGINKEDYVKSLYREQFSECAAIAIGIYQMNKAIGIDKIKELLSREDLQEVELNSIEKLLETIYQQKLIELISLLPPMLDFVDPQRRGAALKYLQKLTGQKLPPDSRLWKQWINDNIE